MARSLLLLACAYSLQPMLLMSVRLKNKVVAQTTQHNLKIVSWNVECLKRGGPAAISAALEKLDADIILTQEDLLYEAAAEPASEGLQIPGYAKASECPRNELWESYNPNEYAKGARRMSNAAYYRVGTVDLVSADARTIAPGSVDPRCAAQLDVMPKGVKLTRPIRIESTHFTGGRFSDSKWEERVGLKAQQAQSVMELAPDIVAGDMNSYPYAGDAEKAQAKYQIYIDAVAAGKKSEYLAWTTEPIDEFKKLGMLRLPLDVQTSQYGGTVDHAFVRRDSFKGLKVKALGISPLSSNEWTLSDHNGMIFDVSVQVVHDLKIVSWNVECLKRDSPAALSAVLEKLDADIILTQEDLLYEAAAEPGSEGLQIPGYAKASECPRNELWESYNPIEYAKGARRMSNAAYYRVSTVDLVSGSAQTIAADSVDPRCAAQLDVMPKGVPLTRPIRIESTHFTGGRFSDSKWEERVGLKAQQAQSVMELVPDIVAGDMNSYPTAENAATAQAKYQIYTDAVAAGKESEYLAWTTEPIDEFKRLGMSRLPLDVQTSQYGGTVDHAFVRRDAHKGLKVIALSISPLSSNEWKLSDHNGMIFDVRVMS